MLRFFRKIRQKILVNGRLRSYSLYAIGEILLVMIGILLALQIRAATAINASFDQIITRLAEEIK